MSLASPKKRRRWPYWLGGSIVTVFLLIFVVWYYAMDYVFDTMIESMLEESAPSNVPQHNDVTPPLVPPGKVIKPDTNEKSKDDVSSIDGGNISNPREDQSETITDPKPESPEPNGIDAESLADEPIKYEPNISAEKAERVQENITTAEKATLTKILMTKLSPSEIATFTKMASGGLNVEDKKAAKKLFVEKLTEDEYNQLIAIAAKYGLSQGMNYEDSVKQVSRMEQSEGGEE